MIKVLWGYRGAPSNGQYIAPGQYDENDEHLFGLAQYLLQNGHAVAMEHEGDRGESEVIQEVEEPAPVEPEPEKRAVAQRATRPRSRSSKK